jgi:NAD(P)-dependent dehydrogenase (short-subunit alcohol dehydrogenase family)
MLTLPALQSDPDPAAADPAAQSLRGRVVLVTGAARGLGSAIAGVLGEAGARLALADQALEAVRERAAVLAQEQVDALAIGLDVTDPAQCVHAMAVVLDRFGRIDALINNAAIDVTAPITELALADWQRILATNLGGPFVLAKLAAAQMVQQGHGGHIVNIASTAAKRAWPNASAYHATKWGLLGLSHALHAELRPAGIKVCAVVTGGMRTPFLLDRFPDIDPDVLQDPLHVARVVRFVLQQPDDTAIPEVTVLPRLETSWP